MISLAVIYFVGLLITNHLLLAWTHSNFPQHLWNAIHKEASVFTKDDLTIAALRYGAWGDLWTCPLCIGTWLGLFVAVVLFLCSSAPFLFIPLGAFSWAGILYPIHKKI
jgi:hypothetical protein